MSAKLKKTVGRYYSPTPEKWRKIGDSILYGCGVIGAAGLFGFDNLKEVFSPKELKIIIGGVLVLGFVGKFITNFLRRKIKPFNIGFKKNSRTKVTKSNLSNTG